MNVKTTTTTTTTTTIRTKVQLRLILDSLYDGGNENTTNRKATANTTRGTRFSDVTKSRDEEGQF